MKLVYYVEYNRIDHAFCREQQIKNETEKKKETLINGDVSLLSELAKKVFRDI